MRPARGAPRDRSYLDPLALSLFLAKRRAAFGIWPDSFRLLARHAWAVSPRALPPLWSRRDGDLSLVQRRAGRLRRLDRIAAGALGRTARAALIGAPGRGRPRSQVAGRERSGGLR